MAFGSTSMPPVSYESFPTRFFEIRNEAPQRACFVAHVSECQIAVIAEDAADLIGVMAVVDDRLVERIAAASAPVSLPAQEAIAVLGCQAVALL